MNVFVSLVNAQKDVFCKDQPHQVKLATVSLEKIGVSQQLFLAWTLLLRHVQHQHYPSCLASREMVTVKDMMIL